MPGLLITSQIQCLELVRTVMVANRDSDEGKFQEPWQMRFLTLMLRGLSAFEME